MAEYAKTIDELAARFRTSRQTIHEWKRKKDFPAPTKRGWNIAKLDAWCKKHSCGPYRRGSQEKGNCDQNENEPVSLYEANRRKALHQSENERIKAERQLVEQARELENILHIDDVRSLCRQMVATVLATIDGFETAVDREIPEKTEGRDRVMTLVTKLNSDIAAAMNNLW